MRTDLNQQTVIKSSYSSKPRINPDVSKIFINKISTIKLHLTEYTELELLIINHKHN